MPLSGMCLLSYQPDVWSEELTSRYLTVNNVPPDQKDFCFGTVVMAALKHSSDIKGGGIATVVEKEGNNFTVKTVAHVFRSRVPVEIHLYFVFVVGFVLVGIFVVHGHRYFWLFWRLILPIVCAILFAQLTYTKESVPKRLHALWRDGDSLHIAHCAVPIAMWPLVGVFGRPLHNPLLKESVIAAQCVAANSSVVKSLTSVKLRNNTNCSITEGMLHTFAHKTFIRMVWKTAVADLTYYNPPTEQGDSGSIVALMCNGIWARTCFHAGQWVPSNIGVCILED